RAPTSRVGSPALARVGSPALVSVLRGRLVTAAAAGPVGLLHLGLVDMPPPTGELVAHRAVERAGGAPEPVVELLHHLEGPATVEDVDPHHLAADPLGEFGSADLLQLVGGVLEQDVRPTDQLVQV